MCFVAPAFFPDRPLDQTSCDTMAEVYLNTNYWLIKKNSEFFHSWSWNKIMKKIIKFFRKEIKIFGGRDSY